VHRIPDDDVISEEPAAETQTAESSSDVASATTESVSDSVTVSTPASSEQSCVTSQQDNT